VGKRGGKKNWAWEETSSLGRSLSRSHASTNGVGSETLGKVGWRVGCDLVSRDGETEEMTGAFWAIFAAGSRNVPASRGTSRKVPGAMGHEVKRRKKKPTVKGGGGVGGRNC